ncbi:regulator of chromosome condensation (RCC1) repeat domain containing protein [Acanthamoeba castellanii str. Neff]|uniref:Regulator of chromosome condensation (RCC1) repeat domain containing protein n=1 Tax=Acanthamoeba castellanii (strain ATCC 30010 / Neff) TaxID=1257118 RepID=L8GEA3_ACACF|nr:regulator of chromosome condensation (RCC1) repeat domain containing protein [Acanthamoeba castellanii str. Neff]ELR11174.1 regulator of chromosome condensation (RCC1) repeat domain containing protein [Acanthamoeba castellanii str. Neff]
MEDERHNIEVALVDKELMHIVFGFLRFTDLASISAVCRASEVTRVLIRGRVLSIGTVGHAGLGYCLLDPAPMQWRMISALASETIVHIATTPEKYDRHHTLAVTHSGAVYAFGDYADGKLGLGHTTGISYTPQIVSALLSEKIIKTIGSNDSVKPFIVDLWCGRAVTLLLDSEGTLYSFGVSSSLGRADSRSGRPLPLQFPAGVKIKSAAMGYNHGLAITTQGEVYSWGSGVHGRLGHGDEQDANAPRLISALASAKATQVACGPEHSLVLTEDNTLYTFGRVLKGQLGYVEGAVESVPWVVEDVAGLGVISAISAAAGQSAVLFESGRVMGLGCGELKKENWLVPAQLVAGEDSVFLVC